MTAWWKDPSPSQASISWVPYNIEKILFEIKEEHVPNLQVTPSIQFASYLKYASINISNPKKPYILISDIFNHPETPLSVIRYIITHELIHLVEKPREIDGKLIKHTPEFRELETKLCPNIDISWIWLNGNFLLQTKVDIEKESTSFYKSAYKDLRWGKRISYSEIIEDSLFFTDTTQIKEKLESLCILGKL